MSAYSGNNFYQNPYWIANQRQSKQSQISQIISQPINNGQYIQYTTKFGAISLRNYQPQSTGLKVTHSLNYGSPVSALLPQ